MSVSKPLIAIDIDDVLSTYAESFITFCNKRWGTTLEIDDIEEDWAKMFKLDYEQTAKRAKEIHTGGFFGSLNHFEEAKLILMNLHKNYQFVIATSRQKTVSEETGQWIEDKFPGIFTNIHYSGIYDEIITDETDKKTKSDTLLSIGANYLIDDQPKHCISAANKGINALLFGDYPWNRGVELPKKVVRVKNWAEVGEYFDRKNR